MDVSDRVVVVTGAAAGIGRALAVAFRAAGAAHVVLVDRDERVLQVATEVGGTGFVVDVAVEAQVAALVAHVEAQVGPIALFASNAGVLERDPDPRDATSASEAAWERSWRVNVMAHVYAARACLPAMRARREGSFLNTVSAAGLLSQIGAAPYSTTKHAAIGFAESLAIAHRDDGIGVSVLCPQAVQTAMIEGGAMAGADIDGVALTEHVAHTAIEGVSRGDFLILPHPKVRDYQAAKTADYGRWIGGMAKLRRTVLSSAGSGA